MNQQYIKKMSISKVADLIKPYLQSQNISITDNSYLEKILALGIERDYNLKDIAGGLGYYFTEEISFNNEIYEKFKPEKDIVILDNIIAQLSEIGFDDEVTLSNFFANFAEENNLKFKDFGPIIRFGLTGRLKAPAVNELCFILGKRRTLDRLSKLRDFMRN